MTGTTNPDAAFTFGYIHGLLIAADPSTGKSLYPSRNHTHLPTADKHRLASTALSFRTLFSHHWTDLYERETDAEARDNAAERIEQGAGVDLALAQAGQLDAFTESVIPYDDASALQTAAEITRGHRITANDNGTLSVS